MNPRNDQATLDSQFNESCDAFVGPRLDLTGHMAREYGITRQRANELMNQGARQADATWANGPHERSVGRTYEKVTFRNEQTGFTQEEHVWK